MQFRIEIGISNRGAVTPQWIPKVLLDLGLSDLLLGRSYVISGSTFASLHFGVYVDQGDGPKGQIHSNLSGHEFWSPCDYGVEQYGSIKEYENVQSTTANKIVTEIYSFSPSA